MKKFIWLFGENVGETANNNSFYFWRQALERDDNIDKYFVMAPNKQTKAVYKKMSAKQKKYVVWRNSVRHFGLYFEADMFFVSLSYRDVRPEHYLWRDFNFLTETPIIYLQHGTLGMKQVGYKGDSYNNNLFRFIYYNSDIKEKLIEINDFKSYQLYYGEYHPRYMGLLNKATETKNTILWFLTWREYKAEESGILKLLLNLKYAVTNPRFIQYLETQDCVLRICMHRAFKNSEIDEIRSSCTSANVQWVYASQTDVMEELAQSKLLITDYSSVGFDFTFLNKPVILFQPDLEEYVGHREFYCDIDELQTCSIQNVNELIEQIIQEKYSVNSFFSNRLPERIDYEYVKMGKHIYRMYDYFSHIQNHKITFVGYNFYGIGGTVIATRALAEALMEQGYLVQLQSLVQRNKAQNVPYALNMKSFYATNRKTIRNYLKRGLFKWNKRCYGHLKYDKDEKVLNPYAGYAVDKWMDSVKSETVISTRESLHLFLQEGKSPHVKNKIYFYHCLADMIEEIFPGCIEQLKRGTAEKAVFVTEKNQQELKKLYDYDHYEQALVLGNALDSSRMISREEINKVEEKKVYRGLYLLRISEERRKDIKNLFDYGRYLKEHDCKNIVIDVYGKGNLLEAFYNKLLEEDLDAYIHYCGFVDNPREVFAQHDAVVDFSLSHSFGMPYIEGVLNGKMVFCMENVGSREVMGEIPGAFIGSYEELTEKLLHLPDITKEQLEKNYDMISQKYSRKAVSEKFLHFIGQEIKHGDS